MRRVIYLCPADDIPTGGIKVIYRHAELLAACGADAYVLHPTDMEFSCSWFSHHVPLLHSTVLVPEVDFVIIPELWAAAYGPQCIDQHVRFAIFVQNGYFIHPILPQYSAALLDRVYRSADLVLSISDDSSRMVALNYPHMDPARLVRVRYSVGERFHTQHDGAQRAITFMPRKMRFHAELVTFALRQHLSPTWQINAIDKVDEATVAAMLSASSIFLSFSDFEGLPLPPLEAALAGNLVIGYTGQGAREYWEAPNFQEIHQGDIQGFVVAARKAVEAFDAMRLSREDLAPMICRLAERFSTAAEADNLQVLLNRIDCCLAAPPASLMAAV